MLKPRIVSRLMSHAALILFAILASVIPGHAATGDITTVAGDGTAAFSGDTGQATAANLNYPSGVAVDSNGNVYVADLYNSRIRKVTPGGVITTVAGNGTPGYVSSEDGGPATAASLNYSYGVAVDSSGNIYIADTFNHRIRKVTPGGVITTVAGNGTLGYSGDGGLAISASLNGPRGVAVDSSGNIYIADYVNHRIRRVTPGGVITTVAGNGTLGYSGDSGPATSANLNYPSGVAVDSSGNIYIADFYNSRIRKVTPGGVITTVAGNGTLGYSGDGGPATSAMLRSPWGVAVDSSGNIYIADTDNSRIRKVTPGGVITTVAGNGTPVYFGDGGPATLASLKYPYGVAVDSSGNIYIADSQNNRIRKVQGADACITWDLLSTTAVTSVVGNINGQPESMGGGSSSPFMSIYGYSNGQQLWVGNTGWVAGPLDIARYVQFNASPTTGNTFTVTNVSFNYGDFPLTTDFNILNFQAYYSTDNWVNSTVLNSTALVYLNTAMSTFNVTGLNVPVASGSTFSLRIYPYALQNGIAMTPTFAIHNNVALCGTTAPEVLDTGSICGMKFNDLNGDGLQDAGELGLPNWTINLSYNQATGPVTLTDTTDASGNYCFNNLPAGTYTVAETNQGGWQQTFPSSPGTHTVTLAAGQGIAGQNFGNKQIGTTGTITIVKDAQPDDPQDFHFTTVGTGLSDFDLDDDPNNGTLPNSKTFTNLAAGVSFTVTEDAVSGWTVPSIQCIVAVPGSTTTFTDQLNRTFTVNLEAGANVTCTFINTKQPTTVSSLGNCTSTNATVSSCQEISPPSGAPFTPQRAVSIGLTGVTGSADICITFNNPPPNNLVFFKYVNNQWKNLYPGNSLSGISNVTYSNGQICFTIQDNSDADEDNTIGTITDPVVIGDDVAQPVMSISTLSDNSVTNNNILNISGTVTDNIGVQGLTVNGNSVTINTDGGFSHALVLGEGANVITAVATDLAGNQTTDSRTITYDITLPTLTVSTPADNSQTRDVVLIVTGTVSKTVTVEIKNITNSTTTYATVTGTDYSGAIQLASGSNTIEVTGTDLAGNKSTSVKRTILYDPNSPALAITDPAHDIQLHSPTTYTIKGTVTDQTNTVVSLTFNNIIYTPEVTSGQFQQEITLSDEGSYQIAVTATDAVGNPPSTATRNIIYTPYPGNINGDGSATSLIEVLKAFQYVIGTAPLTPTEKLRLDCAPLGADGKPTPNGVVDTADVILLLRRIVGLVNWN